MKRMDSKTKFLLEGYAWATNREMECREVYNRMNTLELCTESEYVDAKRELEAVKNYRNYLKERLSKRGVVVN